MDNAAFKMCAPFFTQSSPCSTALLPATKQAAQLPGELKWPHIAVEQQRLHHWPLYSGFFSSVKEELMIHPPFVDLFLSKSVLLASPPTGDTFFHGSVAELEDKIAAVRRHMRSRGSLDLYYCGRALTTSFVTS